MSGTTCISFSELTSGRQVESGARLLSITPEKAPAPCLTSVSISKRFRSVRAGMVKNQRLPENILTPTTKAEDHDAPVSQQEVRGNLSIIKPRTIQSPAFAGNAPLLDFRARVPCLQRSFGFSFFWSPLVTVLSSFKESFFQRCRSLGLGCSVSCTDRLT